MSSTVWAPKFTITSAIARGLMAIEAPKAVVAETPSWVVDGWLVVADPAKRSRAYALSAEYRRSIGGLTAAE